MSRQIALVVLVCVLGRAVEAGGPGGEIPRPSREYFQTWCLSCHSADEARGGVRLEELTREGAAIDYFLLERAVGQIEAGTMPPRDGERPDNAVQKPVVADLKRVLEEGKTLPVERNGSVRRLTVTQYRKTLQQLLGLKEDLTDTLPPDAISRDGFTNSEQAMTLSPQQIDTYFEIAEQAISDCLTDPFSLPVIQTFRVDLGRGCNPYPCPDQLILGANSELLANSDFLVTELAPPKPFAFQPWHMQRSFRFIEGYAGNDTVRGWRSFDSIYHAVFACMRGTPGYPKGLAVETVADGFLLRPAIPSTEIFGESNTYGPQANFKISLRELPDSGNFRITVRAAKYNDAWIPDASTPLPASDLLVKSTEAEKPHHSLEVDAPDVYAVILLRDVSDAKSHLRITLNECTTSVDWVTSPAESGPVPYVGAGQEAMVALVHRLPVGQSRLVIETDGKSPSPHPVLVRLPENHVLSQQFVAFEQRDPILGVHLGLRRDCGSTLTAVGTAVRVESTDLTDFVFEGAIRDFPGPFVEADNVNYLAGIREIGVRHEYLDLRDRPRLRIRSVQFEGPIFDEWPPRTERQILIESEHKPAWDAIASSGRVPSADRQKTTDDLKPYITEVLSAFTTRAFRRPVTNDELNRLRDVWIQSFASSGDALHSLKETLVVVLTSPHFLFLIDKSQSPAAEPVTDHELASRLSYFLWNSPPDERLIDLANRGQLRAALVEESNRLIDDAKFEEFCSQFATEWLSLDKFDVVAIDAARYPRLTRDTRSALRAEPAAFLKHLIRQNLPARNLVASDFVCVNETTAAYYELKTPVDSGFDFIAIPHQNNQLGGFLTQAAVLSGLSNGRESHPIKRGAWLARKIVSEPPNDPPPNVPKLPETDATQLTLRQRLELHRNQPGCAKCHSGIDPWGLPFEEYDAAGRFRERPREEVESQLPDGATVTGVTELKSYLANQRLDQVAYSFLRHVTVYATGRPVTYQEHYQLKEHAATLRDQDYPLRNLLLSVIQSEAFLTR